MAFTVALTPEQAAAGFDRILVTGVRLGAGAQDGRGLSRSSCATTPAAAAASP